MGDEETTWKNRYAKVEPVMDRVLLWVVNSNGSLAIMLGWSALLLALGVVVGLKLA